MQGKFASGDIRSIQMHRFSTAVGDEATAAYSVEKYLEDLE